MDGISTFSRDDVRTIATYQKGALYCVLGYFPLVVMGAFLYVLWQDEAVLFVVVGCIAITLAATTFVLLLATKVYSGGQRAVLGLLALIPCVTMVVLLITYLRASAILRRHGIRAGLLGARMSDFNY